MSNSKRPKSASVLTVLLIAILGAGSLAFWWLDRAEEPEPAATIISWNLQWFPGNKPHSTEEEEKAHMAAAIDALTKIDADILCLQEVKSPEATEELLKALPGYNLHKISTFSSDYVPKDPNQEVVLQQVVIASKFNALATSEEPFEEENGIDPPRGFAFAALEAGEGKLILLWTVHLKANSRNMEGNIAKREESARQLIAHIKDMKEIYKEQGHENPAIVVVGDLNTDNTDSRFKTERTFDILQEADLTSDWLQTPVSDRVTLPASNGWPDAGFDWAFFGPRKDVGGKSAVSEAGGKVSDHRPVLLELFF